MRGVGDEAAQALLRRGALRERGFNLAQHRVQRHAEAADLRSGRRRLNAPAQVAGRDQSGGGPHLAQRPQADLNDQKRKECGRRHDCDADDSLQQQQLAQRRLNIGQGHRENDDVAVEGVFGPIRHAKFSDAVGT